MQQAISRTSGNQSGHRSTFQVPISDPLERLLKTHSQTIGAGHFLLMDGDETEFVFCLLSGWLSLSKCLPDGDVQILDLALPGEIIEAGSGDGFGSAVNIETLTEVCVAIVPASKWKEMKRQRPDLNTVIRTVQASARARIAERMLRLGRGNGAMRVAYALLELNTRLEAVGQSKDGRFQIPMNQRVLGDFVGLTAVHVCRTLSHLASRGIVRASGHMSIEILDMDGLAEIAGVDLHSLQGDLFAEPSHTQALLCNPAYS